MTPMALRLRDDQIEFLTGLELQLRSRGRRDARTERLTKNSIIRAVIDVLPHLDLNLKEVGNEETLRGRIFAGLGFDGANQALKTSKRH